MSTLALQWPDKDPDEILDYAVEWSGRFADGDTIATSTWIVPTGITKVSDAFLGTLTTIWLSGGVLGTTYELVNRVATTGGRTMDQTVLICISEH